MTTYDACIDEYEHYEDLFDPLRTDRKARRKRKAKVTHIPKKSQGQIIAETADVVGLEGGFNPTYQPSKHEQGWLKYSLRSFYDQDLISDVLAQIQGGKEASVYRCEAHSSTGMSLLAAKVYRPRMFRALRNDSLYRQGRATLMSSGRPVKATDHRIMRAIGKKTAFGVQVQQTSWLMHEYTTLQRLHQAGAAVPQPVAAGENAILMSYIGDEQMAASTLNQVSLDPDEAAGLFREVMRNVELMFQHDMVHGDLSAYNVLCWTGGITIIDFPQVTNSGDNDTAYLILQRDIERTCEYFARQGVRCDPSAITDELWERYAKVDTADRAADVSRLLASQQRAMTTTLETILPTRQDQVTLEP